MWTQEPHFAGAVSSALLALQRALLAGRSYALAGTGRAERRPLHRWQTALGVLATAVAFGMVFVPHLGILALSFFTWRSDIPGLPLTLDNYRTLLTRSLSPVAVSLALSLVSTLLAVAAGSWRSRSSP